MNIINLAKEIIVLKLGTSILPKNLVPGSINDTEASFFLVVIVVSKLESNIDLNIPDPPKIPFFSLASVKSGNFQHKYLKQTPYSDQAFTNYFINQILCALVVQKSLWGSKLYI